MSRPSPVFRSLSRPARQWVLSGKGQRENDRRNGDNESRFGDRRKHFVSWTGYHEPTGKRVSSVGRICALPIRSSQPSLQSAFERTELRELEEVTTGLLSKVIEIAFPGQAGRKKSTAASVCTESGSLSMPKKDVLKSRQKNSLYSWRSCLIT